MSPTIWKYGLNIGKTTVPMRRGAIVLCVQMQNDTPMLWALVDPDPTLSIQMRRFEIVGTGHPCDDLDPDRYVGTVQIGPLVWHIFETTP